MENPTTRINELFKLLRQLREDIDGIKNAIDCMDPTLLAKKEVALVQPKTKPAPTKTTKNKPKKVEKVNVSKVVSNTKASLKGKEFNQPKIEDEEDEESFSDFEPEIKTLELKY